MFSCSFTPGQKRRPREPAPPPGPPNPRDASRQTPFLRLARGVSRKRPSGTIQILLRQKNARQPCTKRTFFLKLAFRSRRPRTVGGAPRRPPAQAEFHRQFHGFCDFAHSFAPDARGRGGSGAGLEESWESGGKGVRAVQKRLARSLRGARTEPARSPRGACAGVKEQENKSNNSLGGPRCKN